MDKDFNAGHVDRFTPVVWGVYFARQVRDFIHLCNLCKHQFCWHDQWMFKTRKQVTAELRILNRTMKGEDVCAHVEEKARPMGQGLDDVCSLDTGTANIWWNH